MQAKELDIRWGCMVFPLEHTARIFEHLRYFDAQVRIASIHYDLSISSSLAAVLSMAGDIGGQFAPVDVPAPNISRP